MKSGRQTCLEYRDGRPDIHVLAEEKRDIHVTQSHTHTSTIRIPGCLRREEKKGFAYFSININKTTLSGMQQSFMNLNIYLTLILFFS
jgi:hypothetical protein